MLWRLLEITNKLITRSANEIQNSKFKSNAIKFKKILSDAFDKQDKEMKMFNVTAQLVEEKMIDQFINITNSTSFDSNQNLTITRNKNDYEIETAESSVSWYLTRQLLMLKVNTIFKNKFSQKTTSRKQKGQFRWMISYFLPFRYHPLQSF